MSHLASESEDEKQQLKLPKLLMLVPHEPTLDPRIDYTANSLSKKYEVTVLATIRSFESRSEENFPKRTGYTTVRIPYKNEGTMRMCFAFLDIWLSQCLKGIALDWILRPILSGIVTSLLGVFIVMIILLGVSAEVLLLIFLSPLFIVRGVVQSRKFIFLYQIWLMIRPAIRHRALRMKKRLSAAVSEYGKVLSDLAITVSVFQYQFQVNYNMLGYVRDKRIAPDVAYCHDLYSLQAGLMVKRQHGTRIIYDSHEYYPYQYPYWFFTHLIRFYESVLVRAVDVYITVSPPLASELERVYGTRPIHALPNVEPCPKIRPERLETEMSRLAAGRLKILYQGTYAEGRGLEEVVREWKNVDRRKAALFLRGPSNEVQARLETLADELGLLGESIYVLAPVLEKDLIGAAQEADIGLIPYKGDQLSYRFACPNKLSQYIHAGIAILANKIPYVEEVVKQGSIGLCYDVCDEGSFANCVNFLGQDPLLVGRFKANALVFSEKVYNWEHYEDGFLKLIAAGTDSVSRPSSLLPIGGLSR